MIDSRFRDMITVSYQRIPLTFYSQKQKRFFGVGQARMDGQCKTVFGRFGLVLGEKVNRASSEVNGTRVTTVLSWKYSKFRKFRQCWKLSVEFVSFFFLKVSWLCCSWFLAHTHCFVDLKSLTWLPYPRIYGLLFSMSSIKKATSIVDCKVQHL